MASSRRITVLAMLSVMFLGARAFGADQQGAIATVQARRAASAASAEKLGAGGPGADLKAIARPKKEATTFTGFPAGTLPGSGTPGEPSGGGATPAPARVVLSGDPLLPLIDASHVGFSLDRVCSMADHAGYTLVLRQRYKPSALDAPYSYILMNGRRRIATLFFDRSLKLSSVD